MTRHDLAAWTDCWHDGATWSLRPERTAVGVPDITALFCRAMAALDGVVQHVLNGGVEVDGDTARGRWHIQEHYRRRGGAAGLLLAHYDDTYAASGGRWRFTSRTLVQHYDGPPDLSGRFTTDGRRP